MRGRHGMLGNGGIKKAKKESHRYLFATGTEGLEVWQVRTRTHDK